MLRPPILLFLAVASLLGCTTFEGTSADSTSTPGQGGSSGAEGGSSSGGVGGTSLSAGGGGSSAGAEAGAGEGGAGSSAGGNPGGQLCATSADCSDGNPCTIEFCDSGKCSSKPTAKGVTCEDGDLCNGTEACDGQGKCAPGTPLLADDQNPCTADLCDPATGTISHKGVDSCACEKSSDCNDNNACTAEQCVEGKCVFTGLPQGALCNDSNACTDSDRCDGAGTCSGTPKGTDDGNPCTVDSCDSTSGEVLHVAQVGKACDDGDKCTSGDQCDEGASCKGALINMDDGDDCTTDLCDSITGNIDHKGKSGCGVCTTDADCDDKNPCTQGACVGGSCHFQDAPVGSACDDGNACTDGDQCDVSGKCGGSPKSMDDGDPCTKDECDPASGSALHSPAPGQSCSDGNACTIGDLCDDQGKCVGIEKNINDANECTTDSCDPTTGNISHGAVNGCKSCATAADCNDNNACTDDACSGGKCAYANAAAGSTCDDGNKCTTGDKCDGAGTCAGTSKNVDDGNPCTKDECDPASGSALHSPSSGAPCSDSDACTLGDLCDQGVCKGTLKSTDDANECTTDACDKATGNVSHTPLPSCKPCATTADCNDNNPCTTESCNAGKCAYANASSGTGCDDGNKCTTSDQCDGAGKCAGTTKVCNTPSGPCFQSAGSCNSADGQCTYPLAANGTACSDSNACTLNDACQNGTCVPGTTKTCTPPNTQCYQSAGTCNSSDGSCSFTKKAAGTACDDGNKCATGDTCDSGGNCQAGPAVVSCNSPPNQCYQTGSCVAATGACNYPAKSTGSACDDGNACTSSDVCSASQQCSGTAIGGCQLCATSADCNDGNPCTDDSCSGGKCAHSNNTASCEDGNACTTGDQCSAGSCVAGTAKSCPNIPNSDCFEAIGSCNPSNGQCDYPNKPNGTTCDDGIFCTKNDSCFGGACSGSQKPGCIEP